jgi:hypothetical protein
MTAMPPYVPAGYLRVLEMFDADPFEQGRTWYVDPEGGGDLRTARDINRAPFGFGDQLLWKAGTYFQAEEIIRNMRLVGAVGNPCYAGAYHVDAQGRKVHNRGGLPHPIISGGDRTTFNPYKGMTNAQLMALQPTPQSNPDGTFSQGSMNGVLNWYLNTPYDLMLWMAELHVMCSGGKTVRFTQSTGGVARGLLMEDCATESYGTAA